MKTLPYINKGATVRLEWQRSKLVSLAGFQMKAEIQMGTITGVVRHIHSDTPDGSSGNIQFWIESDGPESVLCEKCNVKEVPILMKELRDAEVLEEPKHG